MEHLELCFWDVDDGFGNMSVLGKLSKVVLSSRTRNGVNPILVDDIRIYKKSVVSWWIPKYCSRWQGTGGRIEW